MSSTPETLGLMIKQAQYRQHRALEGRLGQVGLSLVQWNALREIHRNPGATQHRLAELTFNSDQAFGTLVTRLLKLGLVDRQSGGGRALSLQLTGAGIDLFERGQALVHAEQQALFKPLAADERAQLHSLLEKLALGNDGPR